MSCICGSGRSLSDNLPGITFSESLCKGVRSQNFGFVRVQMRGSPLAGILKSDFSMLSRTL